MKIKDIVSYLESIAPPSLQESYDNAGLIIGDPEEIIHSALITLEITPEVLDEAIARNTHLIISHHPLIFTGIKKLTGASHVESMVIKAIKNEIAIFATHTNFDSVVGGLNSYLSDQIGLHGTRILKPKEDHLLKLVTFVPEEHVEGVSLAIFDAGAGTIGNYDHCSFNIQGTGSFRAGEKSKPFTGRRGEVHSENELRLETIFPRHFKFQVVQALLKSHPYEEVAYDLYPLENKYPLAGMGMIGELNEDWEEKAFLDRIKKVFDIRIIRHTPCLGRSIRKVAICGGSGSSLLSDAIKAGADIFISSDFTYHKFFEAENKILIADIGHYESEHLVKAILSELIKKKFPTFAAQISEVNTNPINYY